MADTEQEMTVPTASEDGAASAQKLCGALTAQMYARWALEDVLASSGARDPADLRCLLGIDVCDISVGEDGRPDVSGVRERIAALRAEKGYLFSDDGGAPTGGASAAAVVCGGASGVRFAPDSRADERSMSDADYYRRRMASMTQRRR